MGVLSHDGSRVCSFFRPAGPTMTFSSAYASDGSRGASPPPPTKSENEGPAFSLSRNVVERRRVGAVLSARDGVVEESELAVA